MPSKSFTGKAIAHELVQVLLVLYSISFNYLFAAIQERASVNGMAMKTVMIVYPNTLDVALLEPCFLDQVGEHFIAPTLEEFSNNWLSLFPIVLKQNFCGNTEHENTMELYSVTGGRASEKFSSKSWFSLVISNSFWNGTHILILYVACTKLLVILTDQEKLKYLKLELATVIYRGQCLLTIDVILKVICHYVAAVVMEYNHSTARLASIWHEFVFYN